MDIIRETICDQCGTVIKFDQGDLKTCPHCGKTYSVKALDLDTLARGLYEV